MGKFRQKLVKAPEQGVYQGTLKGVPAVFHVSAGRFPGVFVFSVEIHEAGTPQERAVPVNHAWDIKADGKFAPYDGWREFMECKFRKASRYIETPEKE